MMNNNKKPEKTEYRNNKKDLGKILTIVFFTLAALILLITLLIVYTPLKDLFFKKPIVEETIEELIEETTIITTEKEETEKTTEETTQKTTLEPTQEETSVPEGGEWTFIDAREAKHQGIVKDIDYENKIITIENANTAEIEKLDKFDELTSFTYMTHIDDKLSALDGGFEDIKIGYYIIAVTGEDYKPGSLWADIIFEIEYSEKKWW